MRILTFLIFSALLLASAGSFAQAVRVMTYNIRYDNPGDGINRWENRKHKVTALIREYDPDIIGVQEALLHQLNDIKSELKDYEFFGVGRDDGKEKGEYSAVFYRKKRFKVLKQETFWLSKTPDVPGVSAGAASNSRMGCGSIITS